MKASLRALLSNIIDYAGLFPPAKLPLHEAIRNYARYRTEPESWMLGRFICPAARLAELGPYVELFPTGSSLTISALARGSESVDKLLAGLDIDLEAITTFERLHPKRVLLDVLEMRLPADVVGRRRKSEIQDRLANVAEVIAGVTRFPYYEIEFGLEWRESLSTLLGVLELQNYELSSSPRRFAGFKLRCGGLEASAFPTPEQVAFTITACRDVRIQLKFTAGLHHPIRRFDTALQTHMHGFLNVFVAGVLAHARGLDQDQIRQIIEDEDPGSFHFGDEGLSWKEYRAAIPEIETARRQAVLSFGSCSFDEPRDDLRALGLL